MKPDWKDAPEWAKWLAMDEDGWFWFEKRPHLRSQYWESAPASRHEFAGDATLTKLESRPATAKPTAGEGGGDD